MQVYLLDKPELEHAFLKQIIFLENLPLFSSGFRGWCSLHSSEKALDVAQRILPPGALELFPGRQWQCGVERAGRLDVILYYCCFGFFHVYLACFVDVTFIDFG